MPWFVCSHTFDVEKSMQEQLEDKDNDKVFAPDEASSYGHVVNMYQCSQATLKSNIEKQP